MPEPKKRFTPEFRDEAVRLAQTSGRSRREIAADLGIGLSTLRAWIDGRRDAQMERPPPDRQEDLAAELKRLRRESEILRQEREILKRATAFFAQEGMRPGAPLVRATRPNDEVPAHRCGEEGVSRPAPMQDPWGEPKRHLRLARPPCLSAAARRSPGSLAHVRSSLRSPTRPTAVRV